MYSFNNIYCKVYSTLCGEINILKKTILDTVATTV